MSPPSKGGGSGPGHLSRYAPTLGTTAPLRAKEEALNPESSRALPTPVPHGTLSIAAAQVAEFLALDDGEWRRGVGF